MAPHGSAPANGMSGYIKLYRQMMSHPKYKDSHHMHLWVHILMKAAFSPVDVDWKGKTVRLEPGQFTAGRKQLSDETGISEQRIKTVLRRLIADSQINQQTSNKCSMFTVLNWEKYQMSNQPSTSHQPAINQPSTTKEEVKERKNTYSDDFEAYWPEIRNLNPVYNKKPACFKVWKKLIKLGAPAEKILPYYRARRLESNFAFFERNFDPDEIKSFDGSLAGAVDQIQPFEA